MGLKKYEIITVGGNKRVRALRSWQVQDRYVNIGDVGGIVYDEKTLSQEGACWLFRGNFNFPGARIGGDSIVDVGEAAPGATGSANLDILGTSTVVGAPVKFTVGLGAVDGLGLSAADFEQGAIDYSAGTNWETWKTDSPNYLRTKAPIFMGGVAATLKLDVPGYAVRAYVLDRDGIGIAVTAPVNTGGGVTLTVPAGQYFVLRLSKNPVGAIVPADATAAQIKTTAVFETKLVVVDSRLELNPANGTGAIAIRSGGLYSLTPGAKYPDSIIQGSKVVINSHASTARMVRMLTELVNVSATIDATTADAQAVGIYHGVYNLAFTGLITSNWNEAARSLIQAYNCDNMVVSPTVFPGLAAAQTANMPFIFQGCNVPNGIFYHHTQIKNTYKNIDFAKAQTDLGKATASRDVKLASSEVEGMYRAIHKDTGQWGALVESYESVKSLSVLNNNPASSYGTTIYKDAYFNGLFQLEGTNVFGNKVRSHPLAQVLNVQPRAVQGTFNEVAFGGVITGINVVNNRVGIPRRFRLNRSGSIFINGVPSGVETQVLAVDPNDKIVGVSSWAAGDRVITPYSIHPYAFIQFRKTGDAAITPEDLAGVTVTTYNGCKIVNTGEAAVNMKGNIRVEDNATLINCSLVGSAYFGGNAVASGLLVEGSAFMSDNASFTKTAGVGGIGNLKMKDNGIAVLGDVTGLGVLSVTENARLQPTNLFLQEADLIMSGNALVTAGLSISGILRLKDNAKVTVGAMTAKGDITVCGSYSQTTTRRWIGKRVIDNENAPEYDNNVKTQYDF